MPPTAPRGPAPGGLVRDSFVYGVGLALQRGLSVLVLPAATRLLDPAEVGTAGAALAVAGFLAVALGLGFSFAAVRLYYDEDAEAPRTQWAALARVQLLMAAGLAAMAWVSGPWWSRMFDDVVWSGALQAAVVLGFAHAAQSTALGLLRAARRVGAFSAVVVTQVVVGASAALVLADRSGPSGLVAGLAGGALVAAALGTALGYRRPLWSWRSVRVGLALSIPFVAHQLSTWVMSLSDRVLIERFLGLERLASYHLAYALANLPVLATDAVQAAWLPRFYGMDAEARRLLASRMAMPVTVAVASLAAAVVLVAPAAVGVLAPPNFDVPMPVIALVVSAMFVRASYLLGFAVLSDAKDSRSIARASGAAAVGNFAANLVAIPAWGVNGAAATTLAAYALMSGLVIRRTEDVTQTTVGLLPLTAVWAAGVGLMMGLAQLPTGAVGWTIRAGCMALAIIVARRAGEAVRRAYELTTTEPSGTRPSTT